MLRHGKIYFSGHRNLEQKLEGENQPWPWPITKHQLVFEVQGRENRLISLMLLSLEQESTFSWDTANEYFGQGKSPE